MAARARLLVATFALLTTVASAAALFAQDEDSSAPKPATSSALKAGDEVIVSFRVRVQSDGSITVPGIGEVAAAGRTLDDIRSALAEKAPTIAASCDVRSAPSGSVFVVGATSKTIELPSDRSVRVLSVLAEAGVLDSSVDADLSHVRIRRVDENGRSFVFELDVGDALERTGGAQNITMFPNDIVIVPRRQRSVAASPGWVYVLGAVRTSGRLPIVAGETPFTITKLVALCGDFERSADRRHLRIIRLVGTARESIDVDFDAIVEGTQPDFELKPDDVVEVPVRK
jgi:polysaccharide biosynthesis/export protein